MIKLTQVLQCKGQWVNILAHNLAFSLQKVSASHPCQELCLSQATHLLLCLPGCLSPLAAEAGCLPNLVDSVQEARHACSEAAG